MMYTNVLQFHFNIANINFTPSKKLVDCLLIVDTVLFLVSKVRLYVQSVYVIFAGR